MTCHPNSVVSLRDGFRARTLALLTARPARVRIALLRLLSLVGVLALFAPLTASAQGRITLAEIIPAFAGSDLGALEIADAPPPGAVRIVRRADVVRALADAGRTSEGLAIPASTRIERAGEHLDEEALARLALPAIERSMSPCEVSEVRIRTELDLPTGSREVEVSRPDRLESGAIAFTVLIRAEGLTSRISAQGTLACPAPVITPGSAVTARVRVGSVRVVAHGVARQAGRVGDVVRVRIDETGGLVDGRVIDASTVEVMP